MKTKRKLIISMLAIIFVLLAVVATVAITFALTQQTIKTTLNIGYTVEDIDGSASATYTIGGVTTDLRAMKNGVDLGNELVFTAADTEDAGNLEFPEGGLALSSTNDNVVIQYTYTNTGDKHFIASMSFDSNIDYDNMKVEYGIWDFDSSSIKYSEQRYALVVPSEESLSYWIRISIDNKAKSASFTGDFKWLLAGCDKDALAYESLTSLEFTGSAGSYSAAVATDSTGNYIGEVIFPSEVNGDSVTTIAQNTSLTQEQKDQVTSVYIPDSVETIGNNAFQEFTNLETVTFEQNETAGSASVQSGTGLTTIGVFAFMRCSNLKQIVIPNTVTTLGVAVFKYCGLTEIELPDSVCFIEDSAFEGCKDLTRIKLGKNLIYFGTDMYDLESLNSIEVVEGNTTYHSAGNCLIQTANKTLVLGCSTSVIPSDGTVTGIGVTSFGGAKKLRSLTIPNGVTYIEIYAFYGCVNLTELTIPSTVTTISDYVFAGCSNLKNITTHTLNSSVVSAINELASANGEMHLTIDTVTEIPVSLFAYGMCTITSLTICDSVTKLGSRAFEAAVNLKNVTLGNGITTLTDAFIYCSALESINIPDGVTHIADTAFAGCMSLTEIIIPANVISIGSCAFGDCRSLTNATFENALGWTAGSTSINSADLANPATAASYLNSTYMDSAWTRS